MGAGRNRSLGSTLLTLSTWIRRQPLLSVLRIILPQRLRSAIHGAMTASIRNRMRFATLPSKAVDQRLAAPIAGAEGAAYLSTAGVNIFAYLRGQFGLGESARMYARALLEAGYPVSLIDIDIPLPHGLEDETFDALIGEEAPHAINLIFVNPDYLNVAIEKIGRARMQGRYVIACWFWELEDIPNDWTPALEQVDEILVASEFVENAFRRATNKPILRVSLQLSKIQDSGLTRRDFGLDDDKFLFLTSFDFNSSLHRKNPQAVIVAFRQAFPERGDVQLLVKSSNGHRCPQRLFQLMEVADGDERIVVRDEVIDRAHMQALQRCVDAYVSLHRAEGFGLGMAECMLVGKPVVATAWSGNLDFMGPGNSCLVDYQLVPVGEEEYPHATGARWAEPNIATAAAYMRRLVDDPEFKASIGRQAAIDVGVALLPEKAAQALIGRFTEIAAMHDVAISRYGA